MQLENTSSMQEINQLLQTMAWTEVTRVLTHMTNVREQYCVVLEQLAVLWAYPIHSSEVTDTVVDSFMSVIDHCHVML